MDDFPPLLAPPPPDADLPFELPPPELFEPEPLFEAEDLPAPPEPFAVEEPLLFELELPLFEELAPPELFDFDAELELPDFVESLLLPPPPPDFEDLPALPVPLVPASPPVLDAEELDLADFPALPVPFVPASLPVLLLAPPLADEPPALFDEVLFPPLLADEAELFDFEDAPSLPPAALPAFNTSPTASAATFNAETAAPFAAPVNISPATSLAVSKISEDVLFLLDFDEEDFFVVDSLFDFFAAIFLPSLICSRNSCFINTLP